MDVTHVQVLAPDAEQKIASILVFKINLGVAAAVGSTFCEAASFQNTKIIFISFFDKNN